MATSDTLQGLLDYQACWLLGEYTRSVSCGFHKANGTPVPSYPSRGWSPWPTTAAASSQCSVLQGRRRSHAVGVQSDGSPQVDKFAASVAYTVTLYSAGQWRSRSHTTSMWGVVRARGGAIASTITSGSLPARGIVVTVARTEADGRCNCRYWPILRRSQRRDRPPAPTGRSRSVHGATPCSDGAVVLDTAAMLAAAAARFF
jgi:hypothetical protein